MKAAVEVKNRDEAAALKRAMDDPTARAVVLTLGTLMLLPTDRARKRVLTCVMDKLDEDAEMAKDADL